MIKVHCFVSCVCEVIKKAGIDHRPYYFGVWDADFTVDANDVLRYHSKQINHQFFCDWYERLYGIELHKWYSESKTKEENIVVLEKLVMEKPSHRHVMVMLDLSLLPERENKFWQKSFPHYVMLERTEDPDMWMMFDPDFRFEGRLNKQRILAAVAAPSVSGGYYFDASHIYAPTREVVDAYFRTCFKAQSQPLTEAVADIVEVYTNGARKETMGQLQEALRQLPILAIRKYAYEHAFAFFLEAGCLSEQLFAYWCDEIERLVKGFTTVQYRSLKVAKRDTADHRHALSEQLIQQFECETNIKKALYECFLRWTEADGEREEKSNEHITLHDHV
ncbi:DUF6005 family protein [Bacillus sp. FSL W7-1360]